jgi:hypothetical protein
MREDTSFAVSQSKLKLTYRMVLLEKLVTFLCMSGSLLHLRSSCDRAAGAGMPCGHARLTLETSYRVTGRAIGGGCDIIDLLLGVVFLLPVILSSSSSYRP